MTTCAVNKIDSNITGLSFAEEICFKTLPSIAGGDANDPIWYGLEPNSYSDFGGDLTTVARQPISATRQRKKGTPTDLASQGGFNIDVTKSNLVRLMQGFCFADAREKPSSQALNAAAVPITSVAAADDSFNAASGFRFLAGHIVYASGFLAANNGRHLLATASGTVLTTGSALSNEAAPASAAKVQAVGFRFASGVATLTVSAAAAILALTGLTAASGVYTITVATNVANADTVTIGSTVYTWKTALSTGPTVAYEVLIGADRTASATNLAAAINATAASLGTLYSKGTVVHPTVTAVAGAGTVTVTAKSAGTAGNAIATTESGTNTAWGAATLASGAGGVTGFVGLGLSVGEWVALGGDNASYRFADNGSEVQAGYARISAMTDIALTFDDTTWTPATDAGTGKTIELYFGTTVRNESVSSLIKTRSFQLEQTLGVDASDETQAQYIEGAVANEFTLNLPTAEKINADLAFIGLDASTTTGLEGLKSGARVAAAGEDAYNTSLDTYRVRLAVIDPAAINQTSLFGFVQQATVTINNNASALKALGYLGGFDVTVGNFDVGGSITAYFQTVEAIRAIRNNSDLQYNVIVAQGNAGFVFDIPLLGIGGGRPNVALNQAVTLPLTPAGAQNDNGYTLATTWFPYLPDVVMPA